MSIHVHSRQLTYIAQALELLGQVRESDPGPMLWPDMESAAETVEVLCDRAEKAEGGLALLQLKILETLRDFQRLSETLQTSVSASDSDIS